MTQTATLWHIVADGKLESIEVTVHPSQYRRHGRNKTYDIIQRDSPYYDLDPAVVVQRAIDRTVDGIAAYERRLANQEQLLANLRALQTRLEQEASA
jgi:hypothetical protein